MGHEQILNGVRERSVDEPCALRKSHGVLGGTGHGSMITAPGAEADRGTGDTPKTACNNAQIACCAMRGWILAQFAYVATLRHLVAVKRKLDSGCG